LCAFLYCMRALLASKTAVFLALPPILFLSLPVPFSRHCSHFLLRSYLAPVAGLASAVGGALPAGGGGHGGVWVIFDVQVLSRVFGRHGRAGIVVDRALHRHGRPLVEMTDSNDVTNSRLGLRQADKRSTEANCWLATSVSPARAAKAGGRKESGVGGTGGG
jgi:hypothetical protein